MNETDVESMGINPITLLDVWVYFNLVANTVLLPILVITFIFSKRAKRHPTLINLCITWILSGVYSLLLFYAGQYRPDDPLSQPLCIAQTSLLYGITPMWSVAVSAMLVHTVVIVNDAKLSRLQMVLMLMSPYIAHLAFSIPTLVLSIQHPNKVTRQRRFLYCALQNDPLSNTMEGFTALVCLLITGLEVHLAIVLYRRWRGMKRAGLAGSFDFALFIRVLVFGVYIFFGMIVNFIVIFDEHSLAPDTYAATIGAVIVLVFGTQADVFRAWCFWRKDRQSTPAISIHLSPTPSYDLELDIGFEALKSSATTDLDSAPPVPPKDGFNDFLERKKEPQVSTLYHDPRSLL